MCCIFKIIYACGHGDVIKAPCEWRDEGRINILGERVACEKSTKNRSDLSRLCMACTLNPAEQDLMDLSSKSHAYDVESYIAFDEKDVMAAIVRNESHFRKRAKMSSVISSLPIALGFPTPSELRYRYCVNEEFLARRVKRKYLQQHLDGRGQYQDFLRASQAHLHATAALNNSIFSVQISLQATTSIANGQETIADTGRAEAANPMARPDSLEEALMLPLPPSLPSSIISNTASITIRPLSPQASSLPSPTISNQLEHYTGQASSSLTQKSTDYQWMEEAHDSFHSIVDTEECEFIISREERGESSRVAELARGEDQEPAHMVQDQLAELSDSVNNMSDEEDKRGRSRPDSPKERFQLDSPEGIARLVEIRLFLGMRPDTKALDIWNFANRNNELMANITGSTLPIRHRHLSEAKRSGFERDPGLDTVLNSAEDKWELRKGFVDVWNSLDWTFEALSGLGPSVPQPSLDESSGEDNESTIGEVDAINIDNLNAEQELEQREDENKEVKTFQLEGKCARVLSEVDFSGKPRVPRYQAKNASRLRMSWTYADPENPDSYSESQDELVSLLSSYPTSPTLQNDHTVSPLSSLPASPASQNAPESLFISTLLSSLNSFHDEPTPQLSLEQNSTNSEEPELSPEAEGRSSSGSTPPRNLERKIPPSLVQSDSAQGKRLLGFLRRFLAMPDSKTPQEISRFIDLHPGLMKAIRTGHVPVREAPTTLNKSKQRQQKMEAACDPLSQLKARKDRRQRFMQASLTLGLKILDWDEIDSSPVPFTPSSPWDGYDPAAGTDRRPDDDDEEECDHWVRTTVSPRPDRLGGVDEEYLMRFRAKRPSPLRTMLMSRELEEKKEEVVAEEEITTARAEGEEEIASSQGRLEGDIADPSEVEIWDEVDLDENSDQRLVNIV